MKKRWSDLSPRTRRLIIIGASVDGAMRIAALVDLNRRSETELRGSKQTWRTALALVNSAGVLPAAYFVRGVRR